MLTSQARFETPNGSRYLQQLCKHLGHRADVTFDETSGKVQLRPGLATLTADTDGLSVVVTAPDADGIDQTRHVIEDHLVRFAFREKLEKLDWS